VFWLMDVCPWVYAVQHNVYVSGRPGNGVMLRLVTVRNDPSRILAVYTRYHPEVEAKI